MRIPPQDKPSSPSSPTSGSLPTTRGRETIRPIVVYYSPFVTDILCSHFSLCKPFPHLRTFLSIWFHYERRFISLQPYFHCLMAWKNRHTNTIPLEDKMKQSFCRRSFCYPICFPSHHSGSGKRQRGIIYAFVDLWLVLIHNAVIFKGKSSKHQRPGLDGQYVVLLHKVIHAAQIIIFCINNVLCHRIRYSVPGLLHVTKLKNCNCKKKLKTKTSNNNKKYE